MNGKEISLDFIAPFPYPALRLYSWGGFGCRMEMLESGFWGFGSNSQYAYGVQAGG